MLENGVVLIPPQPRQLFFFSATKRKAIDSLSAASRGRTLPLTTGLAPQCTLTGPTKMVYRLCMSEKVRMCGAFCGVPSAEEASSSFHIWTMTGWSCSPGDWLVTGAWEDNDYNSVTPPLSDPDQRNELVFNAVGSDQVVMEWS